MVKPPGIEMKVHVAIALLKTGYWIIYMSRLVNTYVRDGRALGLVRLVLHC